MEREREITVRERDRVMHGDELRAIGEGALDLHLVDHLRHALLHLRAAEDATAEVHEPRDRAAVPDELEQLGGEERDGLGVVEAQPAREALLREETGAVQEELVELARG